MTTITIDLDKLTPDELAALKYGVARHVENDTLSQIWQAGNTNCGADTFRYLSLSVRIALTAALKETA